MKRKIFNELLEWKLSENRMPLLLMGARQVGKTYILKEFGQKEFTALHYINFEKQKVKYQTLFENGLDPKSIISSIEIVNNTIINTKTDLLFFDEIQEIPEAITSLKYFSEEMSELAFVCAGSHMGLNFSSGSFPVGKVDILKMYPMCFEEYLCEINERLSLFLTDFHTEKNIPSIIHEQLWKELKNYYITGGLPAVVKNYSALKDYPMKAFWKVRKIQKNLLLGYRNDFSKHAGKVNANHIDLIFNSIPFQAQKVQDFSIKRFRFKDIIPQKSKFAHLSGVIEWLIKTGLVIRVHITSKSQIPLGAYCKKNMFKLLVFDTGLLGCMLQLPFESILKQDYGSYKGFYAENFVAQELITSGVETLYSWSERNSEIEYLHTVKGKIIPIEVKSGNRTKAKSLVVYTEKYNPEIRIKITARSFIKKNKHYNFPLYLSGKINSLSLL